MHANQSVMNPRRAVPLVVFALVSVFAAATPANAAPPPSNDDFEDAIAVHDGFSEKRNTEGAKLEPGEPQPSCIGTGATVWYRFDPTSNGTFHITTTNSKFDTVLSVYTGDTLSTLTEVACNDDFNDRFQARLDLGATTGVTYWIQVGGYLGETGLLRLAIERLTDPAPTRPANDDFTEAVPLDGAVFPVDTRAATTEDGEPDEACDVPTGATVWYTLPVTEGVQVEVRTLGSDFDTVLALYSGTTLDALELVSCNDDARPVLQSRIVHRPDVSETLYIQAGGFVGSTGGLVVSTGPYAGPTNGAFADAVEIDLPFGDVRDTTGAFIEPGEQIFPCASFSDIGSTVWYRHVAEDERQLGVSSLGSGFDTMLAVYEGTSLDELEVVACNDDQGSNFQSMVSFTTVPETTYYLQAGGWSGATGELRLRMSNGVTAFGLTGAVADEDAQHVAVGTVFDPVSGEYRRDADGEAGGGEATICRPQIIDEDPCLEATTP